MIEMRDVFHCNPLWMMFTPIFIFALVFPQPLPVSVFLSLTVAVCVGGENKLFFSFHSLSQHLAHSAAK